MTPRLRSEEILSLQCPALRDGSKAIRTMLRNQFDKALAVLFLFAFCGLSAAAADAADSARTGKETASIPIPLIHETDLFHPHGDPDDHWDLATVYALTLQGRVDLKAVVLDYPPQSANGDPAVVAVSQMNSIAGFSVPRAVGSSRPFEHDAKNPAEIPARDGMAIRMILQILDDSPEPVVISIVGSSRDVALAGVRAPELFREKCRAVYLNAGTGTTDPEKGANREYNVTLGVAAYQSIFDLPCPVYWIPCFETLDGSPPRVQEHGSFWIFTQGRILAALSPQLQNFFLYALDRETDPQWLRYLHSPVHEESLKRASEQKRAMWCTAGFHHLAGLTVLRDGSAVPLDSENEERVFSFDPIAVETDDSGVKAWEHTPDSKDRFLFTVRDLDRYAEAMTAALGNLLSSIR